MASLPRVYMDTCCFVEIAQSPATVGREKDIWHLEMLLRAAQARDIILHTSVLTVAECLYVIGKTEEETREIFEHVLTSGQVARIINPTVFTGRLATDLYWKEKIRLSGPDLLHVAAAMEKKCSEFVTFDGADRPKRKSPFGNSQKLQELGLRVVRPSETQSIPQSYRQGGFAAVMAAPHSALPRGGIISADATTAN